MTEQTQMWMVTYTFSKRRKRRINVTRFLSWILFFFRLLRVYHIKMFSVHIFKYHPINKSTESTLTHMFTWIYKKKQQILLFCMDSRNVNFSQRWLGTQSSNGIFSMWRAYSSIIRTELCFTGAILFAYLFKIFEMYKNNKRERDKNLHR